MMHTSRDFAEIDGRNPGTRDNHVFYIDLRDQGNCHARRRAARGRSGIGSKQSLFEIV